MAHTNEKVNAAAELLTASLDKITSTPEFEKYLTICANFIEYEYSINNLMLIAYQTAGTATHVAGFKKWAEYGRHVKKGAKGIKILAPAPKKVIVTDKDGNETEKTITYFHAVSVFDISQTENDDGTPDPDIKCEKLAGSVDGYKKLFTALETATSASVEFAGEKNLGSANGCFNSLDNSIKILDGMPETQTIKTLAHEIAHSILHADGDGSKLSREVKELEAESTAYIVCNYFNIDSSDYSLGYIAGWNPDKKALTSSLERIKSAAKTIIKAANAAIA